MTAFENESRVVEEWLFIIKTSSKNKTNQNLNKTLLTSIKSVR